MRLVPLFLALTLVSCVHPQSGSYQSVPVMAAHHRHEHEHPHPTGDHHHHPHGHPHYPAADHHHAF